MPDTRLIFVVPRGWPSRRWADFVHGLVHPVRADPRHQKHDVGEFTASDAPFNTWFREAMKDVHGVDISQPMPPLTTVMDVQLKD